MILVTGAAGFIAKNLIAWLKFKNPDEFIVTTEIDSVNHYTWISNPSAVKHVYHLGAISSTTEKDLEKIYEYNIQASIDLFEWCIEHDIPVSYASSASVYGNVPGHINPLNYYAMSKAMIDMWVKDNMHRFKLVRGYRFFNVYGPFEDHKGSQASPIHQFEKQAREKGEITIFEKRGDGRRDFVYVGDVCRLMLEDTRESGIYDVGTSMTHTFSEVASMIAEKYDVKIRVVPFPEYLEGKYQFYTCADVPLKNAITVQKYLDQDLFDPR
jgi:ADP-L-glycero-D-manno-heptose 6-epimerase